MVTVQINPSDQVQFLDSGGSLLAEYDYDETNGKVLLQDDQGNAADQEIGLLDVVNEINDAGGVSHTEEIADASDVSSIQKDSDVNHDNTTGGGDANAHHEPPSAGSFVVDEGTNQFALDTEQFSRDNPNGRTPITALEPDESYELPVFVPNGKSIKLYEQNAVLVDDTATGGFTTDAKLITEVVDPNGNTYSSKSGVNASSDGSTYYSATNSSGSVELHLVRLVNTDTSATFDSPGAIGSFSVVVE